MNKRFSIFLGFLVAIFLLSDCAKRSRPTGGDKDMDAPILIKASPSHLTTNFNEKEIKIYFDEYIKLKELFSQLVVSPPLKNQPIISPMGVPSKYISIKILDTLKDNTTYTFNFGQSIVDNNEGNVLSNFKYVFSTGPIIDSLKVSGTVTDAFEITPDKNITVLLYEFNDAYTDSIIYNEKPLYVGSTLDSTFWEITNIKAGEYMLIALSDKSKNYKFNPKEDKIGFVKKHISVPSDTSYAINLFNEILPYKLTRPSEISKGHIQFGYEGIADSLKVEALVESADFKSFSNFEKEKDTLNYYFTRNIKDSIQFKVSNNSFLDTVVVKLRKKEIDSLSISSSTSSILHMNGTFKLISNTPIHYIDTTKVNFSDNDSLPMNYTTQISKDKTEILFDFKKEYDKKYAIKILPEAITNFFGHASIDTLKYTLKTKKETDYGKLFLTLQGVKRYPVIVQLLTEKGAVFNEIYAVKEQDYNFANIIPGKYMIRVIYDDNKNKKWDTGNYLLKAQPEEVIYIHTILNIRANWDLEEVFFLN
ncbi:MAG TPA: hypothetical protein DDZ39_09070 [Flavobacteriaceae bacterium]|jgi:uncharacterized protein (DUF2141 family)|nr:hypothetical protein [Flavobacteriaceae bacterium]HBS11931.1 hypothetical protein [Flavobacteriaceae bacterium]